MLAILLDGVILFIPSLIAIGILGVITTTGWAVLGSLLVGTTYYGMLNGSEKGQTIGKMALKIQVRDAATGGPIDPGRAAIRYLVIGGPTIIRSPLVFLFILLDALWPLWDPRRQAIHDKVASSIVVKV